MKKHLCPAILLIILLYASACTDRGNGGVQVNETSNVADSSNIKVALQLFDYFNKHEWSNYASLYADSAKFLDPSFGKNEIVQSRSQTISKYADLQKAIPDIRDSLTSIHHDGQNSVIVEFVSIGTLPGQNKLYLPICTVLKIKDGKIIEDHTYFDN